MLGEEAWDTLTFLFIPNLFSVVEVCALCRPLEFFYSNAGKSCLNGPQFVHRGIVIAGTGLRLDPLVEGNWNATAYKYSGVLPSVGRN